MSVTLRVSGLESLSAAFASLPMTMQAGVKVSGESTAYWAIWEWGYATRVIKPGPKTQWGTNPAGEAKVLTIVAPTGYIRVNRKQYEEILQDEFKVSKIWKKPLSEWEPLMTSILNKAAERCAAVIRDAAPIDSGQLRSEIESAKVGESILQDEEQTGFDIGSGWLGA